MWPEKDQLPPLPAVFTPLPCNFDFIFPLSVLAFAGVVFFSYLSISLGLLSPLHWYSVGLLIMYLFFKLFHINP